jgi:hypothetical protein
MMGSQLRVILSLGALYLTKGYILSPIFSRSDAVEKTLTRQQATSDSSNEHLHDSPFLLSARAARIVAPASVLLSSFAAQALPSAGPFDAALNKYWPGSLTSSVITLRVAGNLRKRGYFAYNTIMASSISGDEVNDTPSSLVAGLQNKLMSTDAGVYHLGGPAGVPSRSQYGGFSEFVSHCPKGGNLLVLFAPHVGITKDGVLGQVERFGREEPSASCAVITGVLEGFASNTNAKQKKGDLEEFALVQALNDKLKSLPSGAKPDDAISFMTAELYDIIWGVLREQIDALRSTDVWNTVGELTVLGGVIINRGHGSGISKGEDYFQPLMMKAYTSKGETQLYDEIFGDLPTPRKRV